MREAFPDLYKLSCDYGGGGKQKGYSQRNRETEKSVSDKQRKFFLRETNNVFRGDPSNVKKAEGQECGSMFLREHKILSGTTSLTLTKKKKAYCKNVHKKKKKLREVLQTNNRKIAEYCIVSQSR